MLGPDGKLLGNGIPKLGFTPPFVIFWTFQWAIKEIKNTCSSIVISCTGGYTQLVYIVHINILRIKVDKIHPIIAGKYFISMINMPTPIYFYRKDIPLKVCQEDCTE